MTDGPRIKCDEVFFEVREVSENASGGTFHTYDEAKEYQKTAMRDSNSKFDLITHYPSSHPSLCHKLITKYHSSKVKIANPWVVFFPRSKEYAIVSKKELTVKNWRENPYTEFGSLDQIETTLKE
jgi:hypothetical protein